MAGICGRVISYRLRGAYYASRPLLNPPVPSSWNKIYRLSSASSSFSTESYNSTFPFTRRYPSNHGSLAMSISVSPFYPSLYPTMARSFFSKAPADKKPDFNSNTGIDPASSGTMDLPKEELQVVPKEIMDAANSTFNSIRESAVATFSWIQDATEKILPVLRDRLDLHGYTAETVSQVLYTSLAFVLAWLVMPSILRRLHKYFEDGSYLLLRRSEKIPYQTSFLYALEDPAKVLISLVAFSQIGSIVAPTTISAQYVHQIWKGGALVAFVWFLHRWKTNVFARVLANQNLAPTEKDRFHALDKISSVGLFVLGGMGVAETCGIAAQSVLTVGGVGGVATAFAARDLLGNVLSGFALQFMKPFNIGDRIKAGTVEGQVLDIGLTSTKLLDNDKFPVSVPNTFFSSQVIVNKSRTWQTFTLAVPVHLHDFEKIPQITKDVRVMLENHPKVTLQNGPPLCYTSHVTGTSLLLTVQCNILFKGREDLYTSQQEITLQTLQLVSSGGARLGDPTSNLS